NMVFRYDTQWPPPLDAGSQSVAFSLEAGSTRNYVMWFDQSTGQFGFPQGVAHFPESYQQLMGSQNTVNLHTVWQWLFANESAAPATALISRMRLIYKRTNLNGVIDPYGQWALLNWSGKMHSFSDLLNQVQTEQATLASEPVIASLAGTTSIPNMGASGTWRT